MVCLLGAAAALGVQHACGLPYWPTLAIYIIGHLTVHVLNFVKD